ncbi:MAG: PD40 domain-containing protein, partial [Asticcacaulis sp.]|nr:PD40 domain-containing protein [Asticcacaulis sp.]
ADGRSVYFFSNRPGGLGGDDIYAADRDPETGRYGEPRNLGPHINTNGNEWAPAPLANGRLLFSSDGWPGQGGEDLFIGDGVVAPQNLGAPVNTAQDEFDAVVLTDGTLIVTVGDLKNDGPARLYAAAPAGDGYAPPQLLRAPFNCSTAFNNGPGLDPMRPGVLFYSAYCPEIGPGRMDIFSAPYSSGNEDPK